MTMVLVISMYLCMYVCMYVPLPMYVPSSACLCTYVRISISNNASGNKAAPQNEGYVCMYVCMYV